MKKQYLVKGIVTMKEKRKVTYGFWRWKKTEEIEESRAIYEAEIYATTVQEAVNKLKKIDERMNGLKVNSIIESL